MSPAGAVDLSSRETTADRKEHEMDQLGMSTLLAWRAESAAPRTTRVAPCRLLPRSLSGRATGRARASDVTQAHRRIDANPSTRL
jgi:hypothetical protein